jgi:hypothetical protein
MEGDLHGHHWAALRQLLPIYQAVTTVSLGDGSTSSFWFDVWHEEDCLADRFPALLTHCKVANQSVCQIVSTGIRDHLVPRLSTVAADELRALEDIVAQVTLSDDTDSRQSPLALPNGKLHTSLLYQLLAPQQAVDAAAKAVWDSVTPPCVQFFGWLVIRNRVQSKANLLVKKIVDNAECEICQGGEETICHILFECPFAQSFLAALGFQLPPGQRAQDLHLIPRPTAAPDSHFFSLVLLRCWQLWKRRNNTVFRQELLPLRHVLHLCKEDARLWRHRMPRSSGSIAQEWCNVFDSAM